MFTKQFWMDTAERVITTAAEVALVWLVGSATLDALTATWEQGLFLIGGAAVASLLKSILATRFGNPEDASLVK